MADKSSEVRNYFKLDLLVARSCVSLRHLFKNRYLLFNNGQIWDDSPTCGNNYMTNVIAKKKKISLTPVQKTSVSNGNSNEWDVTTLTSLLLFTDRPNTLSAREIQQLDQEDQILTQLRGIRNTLAHHGKKSIDDVQFNQWWADLAAILVSLGDVDTELDKLKDDSVFESPKQAINEDNVKEAVRLNSLGTQAHKDGKYSDAVTCFTKATLLPGVSNHDRAMFYSNMAASRLSLYEQAETTSNEFEFIDATDERYRALQDAKQARRLWSTWWKGHYRVGKVHAALDEHEKAVHSFERASTLDPTRKEIQQALDESRIVLSRQTHHEYLDPKLSTKTIPEILNELQAKFGTDPETVRKWYSLLEKIDPSRADVIKGHQYELGDIDIKQDYEQAAKYFAKAASQNNAEGMYNLARLTDRGLGVKKDHDLALKLLEQAAAQPTQHPISEQYVNVGVAEAEHALGVRYFEGISVRKNLSVAVYWYQRATDHGNALAPNNLGSMYLNGLAVQKDLGKAEQLYQLAARRGNSLAMENLAALLLSKNNFQMAQIWYDRACEAGNLEAQQNRDQFTKSIETRRQYSSDELKTVNGIEYFLRLYKPKNVPSIASDHSYIQDYTVLKEQAVRGSITAKQLCDALEHFVQALNVLLSFESLTKEQEDMFVHELSQCYRIEPIVAQIPADMYKMVSEVIDRVLCRCTQESNSPPSQLDEDVRLCYATLNINSFELIDQFLVSCKEMYPKSIYFFLVSGAVNGFLRRPDVGLYNINHGLGLEPNNCELLYHKAVLLRHLAMNMNMDMNEAIEAYQTFLRVAPKDHRKVPEVYYEMAICYIQGYEPSFAVERVKELYAEGQQAEKLQLPCFLPYQSLNIAYLKPYFDMSVIQDTEPVADNKRQKCLTDPRRVEVIQKHREWESTTLLEKSNRAHMTFSTTLQSRIIQQTAKSLIGLKPITLKEMNPTKDHVYNGYVFSVTIIEETHSWSPSIHLVVEDDNFDCERMLIYNCPEEQAEYLISKVYTIGSKMHIINPYLRIGAADRKPTVRVDDVSSIVMQSESERISNMCRYCCQPNASSVCSQCRKARYCSKECQTKDWKLYKHKHICRK